MRIIRVGAPIVLVGLLLSGCTGTSTSPSTSAPSSTRASASPSAVASAPGPSASETPSAVADELSCDTMIEASVAAGYRAEGLAPLPKDFVTAHGIDVEDGVSCPWGPEGSPGQEARHVYSWGPLAPGRAEEVIAELQAMEAFEVESGEGGMYLSASYDTGPEVWFFVTDQSIRFAQSKEALRDIVWTG